MPEDQQTGMASIGHEEDITRYVGGAHFDPGTNQINASAFDRTPKDTDGLSVNRVGLLYAEQEADRRELRRVMGSRMKLGRTAVFVQLNVGAVLDVLAEFEAGIFVCPDPLSATETALANPAHALVVGLPFKNETIGSLKAEEAGDKLRHIVHDQFPAVVSVPT